MAGIFHFQISFNEHASLKKKSKEEGKRQHGKEPHLSLC